jgi:hypothetical protein
MTIRCQLFGCSVSDVPACGRCAADLYGSEFVQSGRLEPMLQLDSLIRNAASLRILRCGHCHRLLPCRPFLHEWKRARRMGGRVTSTKFCSEECEDVWLPF